MPQVLERLVLQVQALATCVQGGCAPRGCTDTYMSRAGVGVACRDGMGDGRTEGARACSGTEWYCVGPRVGCRGVDFSDETCFRLREVVPCGSGINSHQGRSRSYSILTMVTLGSYGSRETDQGEILSLHMPGNHRL